MATTELPILEFIFINLESSNARRTRDALLAYRELVHAGGAATHHGANARSVQASV